FISVDKLVYNSINGLPREDFGLKITDITGVKEEIVYSDNTGYRDTFFHKMLHFFLYPGSPVYENNFSFDGRKFKVIISPTVEYLHKNHPKAYQYVLLIGLLFTFLIANNVSLLSNAEKNAAVLAQKMSVDLNKKVKELDCFFEAGMDMMFIMDFNGNIVKVNGVLEKALGIKTEIILKGKFFDLLHPDDKEKAIKTVSAIKDKKTSIEAVDRFLLSDNSFRWFEWRGVADAGIIYGIARDITEKKDDEEKLRASENRFRTLAETAPIAIYTTDAEGKCNYVNSLWKKITGLTDEEAYADGWTKTVLDEEKELLAKNWINVQANSSNSGIEFRMKNKNGQTTWVYGSAAPIIDANGVIQGFVGANIDITEIKNLEKQRKETEERLGIAIKNLPVVISMITTDWIFRLSEGMGLASIGLKPGQVVSMNAREMYKDLPDLISAIERSFKGEEVEEVLELSGQIFKTFLTPARDSSGMITGSVNVAVNITESAKIQKEKDRMFNELEKKNAEMERFIYTVSHDLRNPLVTILGFAGMVKKALKEDNFELAVDSSNYIESAAHSMNDLIRDLLEISRIGRIVNAATEEPMRVLAQEAFKLNEKQIQENGIKVINEIDENIVVNVDKKRMIEAFYNLISNAVKFRTKTGNPYIKAG
ncbi:MAG TPA: PAS domain S-box protein, partial [Candidatus Goldiibacteriota bacterium]|nr:PAS domain S-box protein [Candidatus Goldiibacteriota bacterium]